MRRRKILIISYLFPPAGGIAVQRALSFSKYLPELAWEVHVLSAANAAVPVRDPGLLRHVPESVELHRAFTPEIPFEARQTIWKWMKGNGKPAAVAVPASPASAPRHSEGFAAKIAKRILCPEPEILWVPFALRKATAIIEKHEIDTVLVTVPPFSALVVGSKLKRRFPHIQLVSDFRDEWLSFYLKDFDFQTGNHTYRKAQAIERDAVEQSDVVLAVTDTSLNEIRKRYPEQPDEKFVCVHNGYDPDVFKDFTPREHGGSRVIVTHVGTAYKTASPRYYLDALDKLPGELRCRFETRFVGRISESERAILENRKSEVKMLGFMPQDEALRHIEETDYLLLTMTNEISLPGKLFEYLATAKPILALSPAGSEVDRLIRETKSGACVDPHSEAAIQGMLAAAADKRIRCQSTRASVRRFERRALAEKLSDTLLGRTREGHPLSV